MPSTKIYAGNDDLSGDPCPLQIVSHAGYAFILGAAMYTGATGYTAFKNSPYGERLQGIRSAIRVQVPIRAGNFGAWGALFGSFECVIRYFRSTEDSWTPILAGGLTGGTLAIRGGYKFFRFHFVIGSIVMAVIEGMEIAFHHYGAEPLQAPMLPNAQ